MPDVDAREQRWTIYVCPRCDRHTPVGTCCCEGDNNPVPRSVVPAARLAEVERERDGARDDTDSLIRELATILGPGRAPAGVGRIEFWIGRVGQALGEREAALERAREALQEIRRETNVYEAVSAQKAHHLARAALDALPPAPTTAEEER